MFGFHWYGLIIGVGVLVSIQTSVWLAKRRGISEEVLWKASWWALVGGFIGARLYHVADRWGDIYRLDPVNSLYIWNGGLGIFGGIIGGIIGLFIYSRLRLTVSGSRFTGLLDLVFFGLPLGQTIGRLGNWVNQEVYGPPTNLPWGIYINPENRLPQYANNSTFHPLFAYEALWNLLGFGLMMVSEKFNRLSHIRRSYAGFYLVWYGLGRFGLDFLRPQEFSWTAANLNIGQFFAVGLILVGVIIWKDKSGANFGTIDAVRSGFPLIF